MFNKLFTKILDSSIWLEPTETRIVWITLLAAMDEDGYAHFSAIENLASRARVTLEEAEKAVKCLIAPDEDSGDPDNDGRRIERVPGGFMILNAPKYRGMMDRTIQREKTRLRVAAWRAENPAEKSEKLEPKNVKLEKLGNVHSTTARSILHYLNEKTGRKFEENAKNLGWIDARMTESKADFDGCCKMIDRQIQRWKGTEFEEYLQPRTLFGKEKFDGYYSAKDLPIAAGDPKQKPKPEANQIQETINVKSI